MRIQVPPTSTATASRFARSATQWTMAWRGRVGHPGANGEAWRRPPWPPPSIITSRARGLVAELARLRGSRRLAADPARHRGPLRAPARYRGLLPGPPPHPVVGGGAVLPGHGDQR